MSKKKRKTINWEPIKQDYRTGRFSSRQLEKKYGVSKTYINRKAKKEGWKRDLTGKVKAAVRSKVVSKKAREFVAALEDGNKEEIEKTVAELTDDETIEYAALTDVAFLSMWNERFQESLKIVANLKKELLSGWTPAKYEQVDGKPKVTAIKPLGVNSTSTLLNSIAQAEHKIYHDMRKNLNLDAEGEDPPDSELSEAEKDDLKRLAVAAAKEEIKNG